MEGILFLLQPLKNKTGMGDNSAKTPIFWIYLKKIWFSHSKKAAGWILFGVEIQKKKKKKLKMDIKLNSDQSSISVSSHSNFKLCQM